MLEIPDTLGVRTVFISSPSDVADAREAVRRSVDHVNRLVAKPLGILFEPVGWEDIPTGRAERAQDLINPFVERAHIYIGLLNRRYGRPTGRAESGTEEEYDLVTKRWDAADPKLIVKVFFQKLPTKNTEHPDEQLAKVLAFKKRIAPTDLYCEFDSMQDLQTRVEAELASIVYRAQLEDAIGHAPPDSRAASAADAATLSCLSADANGLKRGSEGLASAEPGSLEDLLARGIVREVHEALRI